jgi:hypothetical protein
MWRREFKKEEQEDMARLQILEEIEVLRSELEDLEATGMVVFDKLKKLDPAKQEEVLESIMEAELEEKARGMEEEEEEAEEEQLAAEMQEGEEFGKEAEGKKGKKGGEMLEEDKEGRGVEEAKGQEDRELEEWVEELRREEAAKKKEEEKDEGMVMNIDISEEVLQNVIGMDLKTAQRILSAVPDEVLQETARKLEEEEKRAIAEGRVEEEEVEAVKEGESEREATEWSILANAKRIRRLLEALPKEVRDAAEKAREAEEEKAREELAGKEEERGGEGEGKREEEEEEEEEEVEDWLVDDDLPAIVDVPRHDLVCVANRLIDEEIAETEMLEKDRALEDAIKEVNEEEEAEEDLETVTEAADAAAAAEAMMRKDRHRELQSQVLEALEVLLPPEVKKELEAEREKLQELEDDPERLKARLQELADKAVSEIEKAHPEVLGSMIVPAIDKLKFSAPSPLPMPVLLLSCLCPAPVPM